MPGERVELQDHLSAPGGARRVLWHAARLLLGAFFLSAVAYKLVHSAEFWVAAHKLWPVRHLPVALRHGAIGAVVGAEAAAAACLVVPGLARRGALLGAALVVFLTALVGPQYDGCACTWQIRPLVPDGVAGLLLRNALLCAAALFVARART